ncbi:hypothetical protein [Paenibacillus dakarensis]|uniref:hypothetical protein n=1 Tax=Paenibacillus dakarensis TaxID=1527293 RepID=UPI0006D5757D|nr:hypothetical protein [Paenibacillus dakarensis]
MKTYEIEYMYFDRNYDTPVEKSGYVIIKTDSTDFEEVEKMAQEKAEKEVGSSVKIGDCREIF